MRDVAPGETVMGSPAVPIREHHRQVAAAAAAGGGKGRLGMDSDDSRRRLRRRSTSQRIMQMIPHRYPFLMIDRVVDVVPGESAIGDQERLDQRALLPGPFPAARR